MFEDPGELATFVLATVTTVILLGIGGGIGYRIGLFVGRPVVAVVPHPDHGSANSDLQQQLQHLQERLRAVLESESALNGARRPHTTEEPAVRLRSSEEREKTQRAYLQLAQGGATGGQREANSPGQGDSAATSQAPPRAASAGRVVVSENASITLSSEELEQLSCDGERIKCDPTDLKRRYPFDCSQQMITWNAGEPVPVDAEPVTVRCHDISTQGLSFFWPSEPDFEYLVISMGKADSVDYMAARVTRSKPVYMHGEFLFLVSCQFAQRIHGLSGSWKRETRVPVASV